MFKNSRSTPKSLYTHLIACSLVILFAACSGRFLEEIRHIEQLQERLDSNQQNLNLDVSIFQLRAEHIENTLRAFTNDYSDTMSKELGDNLSKYKNFKKIYNRHTNNLNQCKKEQEELSKQLENLTADLKAGKLSKDEFKSYYRTEKADIDALISKSKNLGKSLYEIEPEYTRITAYLEPFLREMKP